MLERRTLSIYIDQDDIPAGALEITYNNYSLLTGNVMYIPAESLYYYSTSSNTSTAPKLKQITVKAFDDGNFTVLPYSGEEYVGTLTTGDSSYTVGGLNSQYYSTSYYGTTVRSYRYSSSSSYSTSDFFLFPMTIVHILNNGTKETSTFGGSNGKTRYFGYVKVKFNKPVYISSQTNLQNGTFPERPMYIYTESDILIVNGQEVVDLGLPSGKLWMANNIGAESMTDFGNYYKYGQGSNVFDVNLTAYSGTESPLPSEYDTATLVVGPLFRMPTKTEWDELYNNCYSYITTINEVPGILFCSKINQASLFFPKGGFISSSGTYTPVTTTAYLSSTPSGESKTYALLINSSNTNGNVSTVNRNNGWLVRGITG